jgi:hypothetical protein
MIADESSQLLEVQNGEIKRRLSRVARDVEYDVFGL